jgi:hypothetical protein
MNLHFLEGHAWCSGKVTPLVPRGPGFNAASLHYIAGVRLTSYNPSLDRTLCESFQHWVCPFHELTLLTIAIHVMKPNTLECSEPIFVCTIAVTVLL